MSISTKITIKNRTITALEWLSWRQQGMSNTEIANMLGISPSMARIIARKFRQAGVPDPRYWKRSPCIVNDLSTTTDAGAYVLGILWGTTSFCGEDYLVRHRDGWYIDVVREYLGIKTEGHKSCSRTGEQWCLKITRELDISTIKNLLKRYGWMPRQALERPYPCSLINDRGFIRAWAELHASADVARIGRKRIPTPRLRIYGNWLLLEEINQIISARTGLSPRKLQKTSNEITMALYYMGKSYSAAISWLYSGAELYNPVTYERFSEILVLKAVK